MIEYEKTTREIVQTLGREFKVAEENAKKALLNNEDQAEYEKIVTKRDNLSQRLVDAKKMLEEEEARAKAEITQSITYGATPLEREKTLFGKALQSLGKGTAFDTEVKQALTISDTGTGRVYLPQNVSKTVVTEPGKANPFSDVFTTTINEQWVSLLSVTSDDIAFIQDGEIAKEIAAVGDSIRFENNLLRLFIDVSTQTLEQSDVSNLENAVITKLREAMDHKFYHVLINETPAPKEVHMSLLANTDLVNYEGADLVKAIKKAKFAFGQNVRSKVAVAVAEEVYDAYIDAKTVETGYDWSLKTPEKVLGVSKVVFADEFADKFLVFIPEYAKYNLNSEPFVETEKSVKYGMVTFAITADFDFQVLLKSMFKTATIVTTP